MKKCSKFLLSLILFSCVLMFSSCSEQLELLGKWRIVKINAGEMILEEEDLSDAGITDPGFVKINRSGSCLVNLLGDEAKGTWTESGEDTLSIKYGKKKGKATIDFDENIMQFTDAEGNSYKLRK